MGNININGKSAVHAGSDGKLITSDVCLTPPFCVPIAYTNQAESKMTAQGASSVKIAGNPACNNKSNFKISTGDAPGACAGASSGSIGQMAEFITSSQDVMIEGKPAVRNGDKMVSNMRNTAPQPLMQPPVGNPPAGSAKAPAAMENEFSQQFDFAKVIGFVPGTQTLLQKPSYEIWDKNGTLLLDGALNDQGLTQRFYTPEKQDVVVWLGEGDWKIFAEHDHGNYADETKNTGEQLATLRIGFTNFASAAITELEFQLVVNGETTSGKTNDTGGAEPLTDIRPGSLVDVFVMREATQKYKKIGTITAVAGETHYTVVSPKIKIESATEKHMGAAAATPAAPTPAAPAASAAGIAKQKTHAKSARNSAGNPQATVAEENLGTLLFKDFLAIFNRWTWADFNSAKASNKPTQAHPRINQALLPSLAPLGKPLSSSNLANLQKLVEIAEGQIIVDFKSCDGLKDSKGNKIGSTISVLAKYQAEGKNADFGAKKKPAAFNGMCLCYVKVGLHRANYIAGIPPGTAKAKDSGADWINPSCGFTKVNDQLLPQVEITYVKKKNSTLPDDTKITQPDLIYTLPGDVIVYEQVDPVDASAAGHIDIRTYHNFVADFARPFPLPALAVGSGKHFKVTGVYRKISDTLAMVRVEAFLRIIREQVAGETSLADKERSYHLLTYDKDSKESFASRNPDEELSTYPKSSNKNQLAGAYQITYKIWDDTIRETGWPELFDSAMQDRIAMYLLQAYPANYTHPRRSALGYIMEGKVDKAVIIIQQEEKLSHWHKIINQKFDMAALNAFFLQYTKEASK